MAAVVSVRRVTQAEVARTAGVSQATASFVLSGRSRQMRISPEVERRVRQAASDLQYRPNSVSVSLRTGITWTIGFVSDTVATTPHAGTLIKGALEAARERGSLLLIGETEGDPDLERRLIQTMHDRRADGLILASMYTRKIQVPKALPDMPAILLNALPRRPAGISSVIPDEIEAGRRAATVLLEGGHRDGIYLIGAGPGKNQLPPESVAAAERLAGIGEAAFRRSGAGRGLRATTRCTRRGDHPRHRRRQQQKLRRHLLRRRDDLRVPVGRHRERRPGQHRRRRILLIHQRRGYRADRGR
jgi:LacI family transcriptional regulator